MSIDKKIKKTPDQDQQYLFLDERLERAETIGSGDSRAVFELQ
jgi:hypothetical protein